MTIKRLYIHEEIYDEFREKLLGFVRSLKVGDGTQPDVFIGPVQNSMQYDKAKDLFRSLSTEALKVVLGGTINESEGYFIHPTIIDNPPESARVVREEPFAPIVPILKWSDEEDVIARANATETGLGASVWSKDMTRAHRIANQLESGSVWINSHFDVAPKVPFGGHKASGIGTEWGLSGLTAYCNSQSLWVKPSP
jgi:acyl-CoA reductase-like NAD-dependent aldehyde dehydrogenase